MVERQNDLASKRPDVETIERQGSLAAMNAKNPSSESQ